MNTPNRQFIFYLFLFFVINVLQSASTRLLEDEAYYWVWSENLALGYFDHPPMVAFFIALGGLLFKSELGVRIISVLSFSLMVYLMWKTIDFKEKEKHVRLFFVLIVSLALIQVYGFVSTPDTPLVLFTALFFYAYKRFLKKDDFKAVLLLGFSMAALLYSKYHGVLLIGFTVLSNIKMLMKWRFWAAGGFGILLFLPHLFWQYQNGFPSFVYHLTERSKPYELKLTLTHLQNIIVVVGITFPMIYYAFWKKKAGNALERSYKFTVYGFALFFLMTSFRSTPQAQWLAAMLVPLGVFVFPYFVENEPARKWLYRLGLAQLVLLFMARVFLAFPSLSPIEFENHFADTWVPTVKEKTGGSPIVFVNSYQNASIYKFYTGIETHSFGTPRGRKSQYNLLDTEDRMQGQSVYIVGRQLKGNTFLSPKGNEDLFGKPEASYLGLQKLTCTLAMESIDMNPGDELSIPFTISNGYSTGLSFENVRLMGVFQNLKKEVQHEFELNLPDLKSLEPGETRLLQASFKVSEKLGDSWAFFRIGASFDQLPTGLQGNKVLVNFDRSQD